MSSPPVCNGCGKVFAKLSEESCIKCQKKCGLTAGPELNAIERLEQCHGCGKAFNTLSTKLCEGCLFNCAILPDESIPMVLRCDSGLFGLIQGFQVSRGLELTAPAASAATVNNPHAISAALLGSEVPLHGSDTAPAASPYPVTLPLMMGRGGPNPSLQHLVHLATDFQDQSLDVRLQRRSAPWPLNASLKKAVSASSRIRQEQRDKKDQHSGKQFKITAALWTRQLNPNAGGKMHEVTGMVATSCFQLEMTAEYALKQLLTLIVAAILETPGFTQRNLGSIAWEDIHLFSQNGKTVAASILPSKLFTLGSTVQSLFDYYLQHGLGTKSARTENHIELRFVYDHHMDGPEGESTENSENELDSGVKQSSHKRGRSDTKSSAEAMPPPPPKVLRSGYRPPTPARVLVPEWNRDPPLTSYFFTRYTIGYEPEAAKFTLSTGSDTAIDITLKSNWVGGLEMKDKTSPMFYETGYLGRGVTKFGLYARFCNQEYALTFLKPEAEYTKQQQLEILGCEYKLLLQGEVFKNAFVEYFEETQAGSKTKLILPGFYFNVDSAFLGQFSQGSPGHEDLRTDWFLATRLFPCAKINRPVQKFTGNNNPGVPSSHLEQMVHAFVHFSYLYSHQTFIFCDLQGVIDPFKKLCLIDPQSHTAGPRNSQQDIYWDLKNKGINLFFQEHDTACSRNPFCNFLDLRNLHFEKPDSQGSQSEGDDEDEDESEEKQGEDRVSKGTGSEAEEDDDRQDVGAQ